MFMSGLGLTLGTLIYLIVKLMIFVLAIVFFIAIISWIRDNFFKSGGAVFVKELSSDPIIKIIATIVVGILGLVIIVALVNSIATYNIGSGMGSSMGSGMGMDDSMKSGQSMNFSPAMGIGGVLVILIKVLMYVLVISLIMAAIVYIKNMYDAGKLNIFKSDYTNNSNIINIPQPVVKDEINVTENVADKKGGNLK